MTAPQNFRSAFNGFNREDVVHYLEYLNSKHQSQVNQLSAELEELRSQPLRQPEASEEMEDLEARCRELTVRLEQTEAAKAELEARCAQWEQAGTAVPEERYQELTARLERAEAAKAELEARCAALEQAAAGHPVDSVYRSAPAGELEAYRCAQRVEREARERTELMYYQANGILNRATSRVEAASQQLTGMADQVAEQLTQLQIAVTASKQALQDAASIMEAIRPNA